MSEAYTKKYVKASCNELVCRLCNVQKVFFVVSHNVQGYNGFISVVESIDHKVPKTECVHHGNAYPEWTQLVA